jgi:DNA-binding NarL/FixJ family response regulator
VPHSSHQVERTERNFVHSERSTLVRVSFPATGRLRHLTHQVRGVEDGAALIGQHAQQGPDPPHPFRVEAVDRLVHHDGARPAEERGRDAHPLAHAEAEAAHTLARDVTEADELDDLVDPDLANAGGLADGEQVVAGRPGWTALASSNRPSSAIGAGLEEKSRPLTRTRPLVGTSSAAIIRSVVDFPAPFGPRNPVTTPGETVKVRPSTATWSPYRLVRFSTSILLADDQPMLRLGFCLVLNAQDDMQVVGEAADGAAAVSMTAAMRPSVVLMDVRMPGMDGIEATRRIVESASVTRVLILTTFDLDEYAYEGLRAGASGFLLKNIPPPDLMSAIRAVASGDAVVAPSVTRRLLDTFLPHLPPAGGPAGQGEPPELARLTARERGILAEVASGLSNAEIAAKLVLAEATVKTHVGRVLSKLQLRDRVQAVVYAYEHGLIRPGAHLP